jgi:hypothetical protein
VDARDIGSGTPALAGVARQPGQRHVHPPCAGRDEPLPADDPLRITEDSREGPDPPLQKNVLGYSELPTAPLSEVGLLRFGRLRRQLRAWETMAALEERQRSASGDEVLDLLYKRAALHYHEADVLYSIALASVKATGHRAIGTHWYPEHGRHLRAALDAFERLAERYPRSPHAQAARDASSYWRRVRGDRF